MTNVQIAVRLRREACVHAAAVLAGGSIGVDDLLNKVARSRLLAPGFFRSRWCDCRGHVQSLTSACINPRARPHKAARVPQFNRIRLVAVRRLQHQELYTAAITLNLPAPVRPIRPRNRRGISGSALSCPKTRRALCSDVSTSDIRPETAACWPKPHRD